MEMALQSFRSYLATIASPIVLRIISKIFLDLLVYDLKFVGPLDFKLVEPMPEL